MNISVASPSRTVFNAGTDCTQTVIGNLKKFWGNTYGYDAWGNLLNKSLMTNTCAGEGLSVAVAATTASPPPDTRMMLPET